MYNVLETKELKELLLQKYTISELADKMKISSRQIQRLLNEDSKMSLEQYRKFLQILN